jgi:large subunit ribosomal protein L10
MVGAAKIAKWKIDEVEELKAMLKGGKTISVATFHGLPSSDFQKIRSESNTAIKVSRNSLIKRALEESGMNDLAEHIEGESALVVSGGNAFELYSAISGKKFPLPAKAGQIATSDIIIKKGDTSLRPGPVLSELQKAGVPAAIDGGKVVIKEDKVLVKAGERIGADAVLALNRLEIFPFEASLNTLAVFEDGIIFHREDLEISTEDRIAQISRAYNGAIELALATGFISDETIEAFLSRAHRNAISMAMQSGFVADENIEALIREAQARADVLSANVSVPSEVPEKKEEKSEEDIASGLGALFG